MRFPISLIIGPVWVVLVSMACISAIGSTQPQPEGVRAAGPPVPRAPAAVTAFVDVSVVPLDQERVLLHQTVLVAEGRITALGPVDRVRVPVGARRINGRGQYLIPGLADMHPHVAFGDSVAAERTLFLFLANGVTTIRNADYTQEENNLPEAFFLRLRARAAADDLVSPRIYTSGQWSPKQYINRHDGDPPRVLDSVTAYEAAGYDFVKIHDEDSVISEAVLAAGHRVGIPVIGHVNSLTLEEALAAGYASIEHLTGWLPDESPPPWGKPSETFDTSRIAARAAATRRAGVWNCPTLELFELGAPDIRADTLARWPELRYAAPNLLASWQGGRILSRGGLRRGRLVVSHGDLQEMCRMLMRWYLTPSLTLLTMSVLPDRLPVPAVEVQPVPGRLVAKGTIHPFEGAGDKIFLPVTVHRQAMTVILDVGAVENILSPTALAQAGLPQIGGLDSLVIGTAVEHNIPVQYGDMFAEAAPPGLPPVIGLLGTSVLTHYDLVIDGPARRVRLSAPPPQANTAASGSHPTWLPERLTPSDCVPLLNRGPDAPGIVGMKISANGHELLSIFDSGADWTIMNLPAAKVLGITKHTTGIHLLPPDSSVGYPGAPQQKNYRVPGVIITVGAHPLRAHSAYVFQRIPEYFSEAIPEMDLGLDAVRDRLLVVSYSTHQVCFGAPTRAPSHPPTNGHR